MRRPVIAGNWKMNGLLKEARDLAGGIRAKLAGLQGPEVVLCPPFLAIPAVREILAGSPIRLGAQDVFWKPKGAYTGEVSPAMLADAGCSHVVIGHSERRELGETDKMVNDKVRSALEAGLTPILCVGERLEEREKGVTFGILERQVVQGLSGFEPEKVSRIIVAYEPVWAIGTGKTATPAQAQEVHDFIRKLVAQGSGAATAEGLRILYGGSVKPDNIKELMAQKDLDGALVGGASLEVDSFMKIARYQG
jgi:triosephosphate isomerase